MAFPNSSSLMKLLLILLLAVHSLCTPLDVNASIEVGYILQWGCRSALNTGYASVFIASSYSFFYVIPLQSAEDTQESPQSPIDEVEPSSTPVTESPGSEDEGTVNERETVENTPIDIADPAFSVVDELLEEAEDLHEPDHSSPSEASPVDGDEKDVDEVKSKVSFIWLWNRNNCMQQDEHIDISSGVVGENSCNETITLGRLLQKDDTELPTESDEEQVAEELAAEAEQETEQPDPELLQELQELQTPVESVPTAIGAAATIDGVAVRFELQETWAVRISGKIIQQKIYMGGLSNVYLLT